MLVTSGLLYAIVPSGATLALRVLSSLNINSCKSSYSPVEARAVALRLTGVVAEEPGLGVINMEEDQGGPAACRLIWWCRTPWWAGYAATNRLPWYQNVTWFVPMTEP